MRRIGDQLLHWSFVHRPQDQAGLRAAALDLARSGLRIADIARVPQVGEGAVEHLLQTVEARP